MQPLRIFIECHPNRNMRTAHLSIPLTEEPFSRYGSEPIPERAKTLAHLLDKRAEVSIDGVISGSVGRKEIRFERNMAFSWDETIAAVVEILGKFYNRPTEVEIMARDPEWDKPRSEHEEMY